MSEIKGEYIVDNVILVDDRVDDYLISTIKLYPYLKKEIKRMDEEEKKGNFNYNEIGNKISMMKEIELIERVLDLSVSSAYMDKVLDAIINDCEDIGDENLERFVHKFILNLGIAKNLVFIK